jgi:hypothetical protein
MMHVTRTDNRSLMWLKKYDGEWRFNSVGYCASPNWFLTKVEAPKPMYACNFNEKRGILRHIRVKGTSQKADQSSA